MNFILKNNSEKEKVIRDIIFDTYIIYDLPIFCNKVIIDEKLDYSYSHPEIHISGQMKNILDIIETIIHEQFHHFEEQKTSEKYYKYIEKKYKYIGYEFDKIKTYPVLQNFAQHLIVCYNTINMFKVYIRPGGYKFLFNKGPYKIFETFVIKNMGKIKEDLAKFDAVYKISKKIVMIKLNGEKIQNQLDIYDSITIYKTGKEFGKYKVGKKYKHKKYGLFIIKRSSVLSNEKNKQCIYLERIG